MSYSAQNLIELQRLAQGGAGALTQHLLREMASSIITPGVADACGPRHRDARAAAVLCDQFLRNLAAGHEDSTDAFEISPLLHIE